MYICIDFDGTIVEHRFPHLGLPVPGAIEYMKAFQKLGAKLILFTMRSDGQEHGDVLTDAVRYCQSQGIEFYGINHNPDQDSWTSSPKAYGEIYIDDAAFGCPLVKPTHRPYVDWEKVGPAIIKRIIASDEAESD